MKKILSITTFLFLAVSLSAELPPLKKSVTWEKINKYGPELQEIGHLVNKPSTIDMQSWWSVGCETLDRDFSNFENYKQYVGQTGVGYARIQSGWAKCEPEKGKYNLEWLDKIVDGLIAEGVKPWMCLCYGNPIYTDTGHGLDARLFTEGPVMEAWENYVTQIVKRYKGKISMYEVWNEPDGGGHLDAYDTYAVLFDHTSRIIREYDEKVKIAGLAICTPERPFIRKSIARMKEIGCLDRMDYLTYHHYYPMPESVIPMTLKLREDLKKLTDKEIVLLQGESGCPGSLEPGPIAISSMEWTEYSQAKWDLRNMLNHFGIAVPYSVFTMVDLNYAWKQQSYGLVRMTLKHVPVYLKPKFYAVQHVTSVFTSETEAFDGITLKHNSDREIRVIGIKKNGEKVGFALWYCDQLPDSSMERDQIRMKVEGLHLSDPVYVDMLTGKVYELPNSGDKFRHFHIWDSPVLVIERNAVDFE